MTGVDYDRQKDVLTTLTSCLIKFGLFVNKKDISLRKYENAKETGFLYRAQDYTRLPGELRVVINNDGTCRAKLSGSFYPADPRKQIVLEEEIRKAVCDLNKKLSRQGG